MTDEAGGGSHRLGNIAVLGGALLVALAAVHRYTHVLPGSDPTFQLAHERCYGVARAHMNDCGTSRHACAGRTTVDASSDEWISVPAGTCGRIAGGRLRNSGS